MKAHCSLIVVALLLLFVGHELQAQIEVPPLDPTVGGTLYYLAFPDTTTNITDPKNPNKYIADRKYAYVYSAVDGNTVTYGGGSVANTTMTINAGEFGEIDLTKMPVVIRNNVAVKNVLRLESQYPVIVYAYMVTQFGGEMWLPLPVNGWGSKYFAATFPGEVVQDMTDLQLFSYTTTPKEASGEILIIAAYDDTRVDITSNAMLVDCNGCDKNIVLNAGEAYQVQSVVDPDPDKNAILQPDLAGSYITADKPIGVISGNTRAKLYAETSGMATANTVKNMLVEWLTPVGQHGTEFVYLPTYDSRWPRVEGPDDRVRTGELVRIYPTSGDFNETYIGRSNDIGEFTDSVVVTGNFLEYTMDAPIACYFKTDAPVQAMMAPLPVIKNHPKSNEYSWYSEAWGSYMVTMVPREHWTNLMPVKAPDYPLGTTHYINIVTDTNNIGKIFQKNIRSVFPPSQVFFSRRIAGTDLIWMSREMSQGEELILFGENGATFSGSVYGFRRGTEELVYNNYAEEFGFTYAYPFVATSWFDVPPGELDITFTQDCEQMVVDIQAVDTIGIRSVVLDHAISNNARLKIEPKAVAKHGVSHAVVTVTPIDPMNDAEGVIVIRDRSRNGVERRIPYTYQRAQLDLQPTDLLNFGEVQPDDCKTETVTVTNPMDRAIELGATTTALNNQYIRIKGSSLSSGMELQPGASMTVDVEFCPDATVSAINDTLLVEFDCLTLTLPVAAKSTAPVSSVEVNESGARMSTLTAVTPNPLTEGTDIQFALAANEHILLEVYNMQGERIAVLLNRAMESGEHVVHWDAAGMPSGQYHVRLTAGSSVTTMMVQVVR